MYPGGYGWIIDACWALMNIKAQVFGRCAGSAASCMTLKFAAVLLVDQRQRVLTRGGRVK